MMAAGLHFRLIKICFAIHGFVAAATAFAEPTTIDKLFKHYQDLKVFEADFKQKKLLRQEDLELESSGTLHVALGKALLYEVKAPGRLAVFLDDQALEIRSGDGKKATKSRYELQGGAYSEKIADNLKELTALLAMDRAALDKSYTVTAEPGKIVLTPVRPRQFVRVVMTLGSGLWLRRLDIEERSGDQMVLDFAEPKATGTQWIETWKKSG